MKVLLHLNVNFSNQLNVDFSLIGGSFEADSYLLSIVSFPSNLHGFDITLSMVALPFFFFLSSFPTVIVMSNSTSSLAWP
jgi:hypothetical protein